MIRSSTRSSGEGLPILPRALRRDIILVLTIKIAALLLISQLFFQGGSSHSGLKPNIVAQHLLSSNPSSGELDGPR